MSLLHPGRGVGSTATSIGHLPPERCVYELLTMAPSTDYQQQPTSLTWKWSIYNVFGLIWVTEPINNKNPLDDTLSPLGICSNLHKTKMAAIVLLNIL